MVSSPHQLAEHLSGLLDRWEAAPFSEAGTNALAEAVMLRLVREIEPSNGARDAIGRLARLVVALQHGAAGDGASIAGHRRSREDCRETLAALLVPSVDRRHGGGTGGRPADGVQSDVIAWGFTQGRTEQTNATGRRMTDVEVADWLAYEILPAVDRERGVTRKQHKAPAVLRAWQRIKQREKQTRAMLEGAATTTRRRTSRR
jgi:hypothetical protein